MSRVLVLGGLLLGLLSAVADGRPRIGLALGGGSARGMAHVGVLEWLDAHRVPVDLVAGTSMGGLIAGTYATGLSGAEIRKLLGSVDWDRMFLGEVPYPFKSIRRKQDARLFPSRLGFGLRNGLSVPSGIDPGHQVGLLLSRITLSYSDISSFDELPTPFRCTATDMTDARLVVFRDGPLAEAMRATMSLPGVFPPVLREGHVLVDGGVLNNVPADVVREMGADHVIAVDVGFEPGAAAPAATMFGLLSQTLDVFMLNTTRQVLRSADLVLRPDLKEFGMLDWRRSGGLADRGWAEAEAHRDELLPLALEPAAWAEHQASRRARICRITPVPVSLSVLGVTEPRERRWIEELLRRHVGGPLDRGRLERDLTRLAGTDRYEALAYRVMSGPEGERLIVDVHPKRYGPPFFVVALDIDNTSTTDLRFTLQGRMTAFDMLGFGSELRVDLRLGSPLGVAAELYRPLGRAPLFLAPHVGATQTLRPVYGAGPDSLLGESRVRRAGGGLDLGTSFGSKAELRVGYDLGYVNTSVYVGEATLPSLDGWEQVGRVSFEFDGQDSALVPSRGVRLQAALRHVFEGPQPQDPNESSRFSASPTLGELGLAWALPLRGRHRLFGSLRGATSFDTRPIGLYRFTLGGPTRLSAFRADELSGRHALVGSAGYLHRIGRLPDFLGGPVYLGGWIDVGSAFDEPEAADLHVNQAGAIVAETLLGPLVLGASVGAEGEGRVFAALGTILR
jgi:NTE family protein